MTIFRFALIRSLREKSTLLALSAVPLAMIFIRPLWTGEEPFGYALYSIVILFAAFSLVRSIMTDRVTGTIVRIYAAPVTTLHYLLQNLLAYLLLLVVQTMLALLPGAVLYQWGAELTGRLVTSYIVFAATCIALTLAWNSLFRSKEMSGAVFSIVVSVMAMLGGVFVPLALLPDFLQKIGMLFPTYWLSRSLLSALSDVADSSYWLSIAIMFLFAAAFLLFGSKRRLE